VSRELPSDIPLTAATLEHLAHAAFAGGQAIRAARLLVAAIRHVIEVPLPAQERANSERTAAAG